MSGYVLHPEALLDLDEIWEFIAQDDIDAADRVLADFLDTIRALVHFPQQGTRRPDLTSQPLRFTRVRDYLIAYAPDENPCGSWPSCMDAAALGLWRPSSEAEKLS